MMDNPQDARLEDVLRSPVVSAATVPASSEDVVALREYVGRIREGLQSLQTVFDANPEADEVKDGELLYERVLKQVYLFYFAIYF